MDVATIANFLLFFGAFAASLSANDDDSALREDAADALLTATEALYRAPLGDAWDGAVAAACAEDGPADTDPVACVLAAAWSRLRVMRGQAVSGTELARLASVAPSWVRALTQRGEVAATRGTSQQPTRVEAAEARRWLASRGLTGW